MADKELTRLLKRHARRAPDDFAVAELAADIAHELAQPLGAIGNYTGALERTVRKGGTEAELLELTGKLRQQVRASDDLLAQLREFSQNGD